MKFKASLFACGYWGHFLTLLYFLFGFAFITSVEYVAAAILSSIFVMAIVRLYFRSMSFDNDIFCYDGWFYRVEIRYAQILKINRAAKLGWPADRWHGPSEYCIFIEDKKIWISLLWFDQKASQYFFEQFSKKIQ